jgi:curved DNA-binding protein CbpA
MASKDALEVFRASLEKRSYYEILRVARDADAAAIRGAFHDFSLLYHPDRYVERDDDVRAVASDIFKRGAEAYRCVSRPASRQRYDRALSRGRLRLDGDRPSTVPPAAVVRTLETVAQTARAKQFAVRADRLIAAGKLDEARVQLVSACQCEPDNDELNERLQILYEALALEPM